MSLIGPVSLKLGEAETEVGDYVNTIRRQTPAPVTQQAINRDYTDIPLRGYGVQLLGVEEDLSPTSLWGWLYDNRRQRNVPITWTTDGSNQWAGVIDVVPDPTQGGVANQHGTFDITLPLVAAPTLTRPAESA